MKARAPFSVALVAASGSWGSVGFAAVLELGVSGLLVGVHVELGSPGEGSSSVQPASRARVARVAVRAARSERRGPPENDGARTGGAPRR